jgi:hypothetical protein
MARKKGKSVSFDAMIKFFLQYYSIPTRKDIEKLMVKIDRLEMLIKASGAAGKRQRGAGEKTAGAGSPGDRPAMTSTDMVLEVIRPFKKGIRFAEIQARTGFGEKKLRNIIFRLSKMKKITSKRRGVYIAS